MADQADSGAVTLLQRFGSAANLNIHLHCLVLDGVYRRTEGGPVFVEAPAPTDEALQALLDSIIGRVMRLLTRRGVLVLGQFEEFCIVTQSVRAGIAVDVRVIDREGAVLTPA